MILKEEYRKQPTSGAVSWNTNGDLRGILVQLAVNPSATTTTYNFRMTNDAGTDIYDKKGMRGMWTDDTKVGLYGKYTLAIQSASTTNVSYVVTLLWDEKVGI